MSQLWVCLDHWHTTSLGKLLISDNNRAGYCLKNYNTSTNTSILKDTGQYCTSFNTDHVNGSAQLHETPSLNLNLLHPTKDSWSWCSSAITFTLNGRMVVVNGCKKIIELFSTSSGYKRQLHAGTLWLKKFQYYLVLGHFSWYLKVIEYRYPTLDKVKRQKDFSNLEVTST